MVTIRCYPRLHVCLIDLGNATFRKYGGAGFYIGGPPIEIEAAASRKTKLFGLERLDRQVGTKVERAIERLKLLYPQANAKVILKTAPPQHIGLGTSTSLLLGVLKAIDVVTGTGLPDTTLQTLSGRGGASGIGVNAFFSGGFLVDAGHDAQRSRGFAPSSSRSGFIIPPVICRLSIPQSWRFHLILLPGYRASGSIEKQFFRSNTPIPARDVLKTLSLVYHGIAPAVSHQDMGMLRESLQGLHNYGFKRKEVRRQPRVVQEFLRALNRETHLPGGMSSLGPLIYAVADKEDISAHKALSLLSKRYGAELLGCFPGRNKGFEVLD